MLSRPVAERLTTQQIHHRDVKRIVLGRGVSEKFRERVADNPIGSTICVVQRQTTRPGRTIGMVRAAPPDRQARKTVVEKCPTLSPVRSNSEVLLRVLDRIPPRPLDGSPRGRFPR